MADDDIDVYGDDFEYDTAGIPDGDNAMNEYDTEPAEIKREENVSIPTHTSRAQEVVGTKRARDEEHEDRKPSVSSSGPNLPAKPNEVRHRPPTLFSACFSLGSPPVLDLGCGRLVLYRDGTVYAAVVGPCIVSWFVLLYPLPHASRSCLAVACYLHSLSFSACDTDVALPLPPLSSVT